jgi:hypothetical protein
MPFQKGHSPSKETRDKISKANKGRLTGIKNPFYGKTHTPENIIKIKKALKGKYTGSKAFNWKGGRHKNSQGYIQLYMPYHPNADRKGRIYEHRFIIELYVGRPLKCTERVHHIGERDDNNPHMLIAFVNESAHKRFHNNHIIDPSLVLFDGRSLK